jgi:hypothetical protein
MPTLERPTQSGDVALAGPDGKRVSTLIDRSETSGTQLLYSITRQAVSRLLGQGAFHAVAGSLFNADELSRLTEYLSGVIATGDLLGRGRIHEKYNRANAVGGYHRFAEIPNSTLGFVRSTTIPILAPEQAVRYFAGLVPSLALHPERYGQAMRRAAFTLAQATETTLISKVQELILSRLVSGEDWQNTPAQIDQLLADAGVHPSNPQYSQMVFRTNAADAFNVGQTTEVMENPEVRDFFPAWEYLGIRDGREGDDHRPHFGRYYPNSLSFHFVRGPRVFNCRCGPRYIDRYEWADLSAKGATLSHV